MTPVAKRDPAVDEFAVNSIIPSLVRQGCWLSREPCSSTTSVGGHTGVIGAVWRLTGCLEHRAPREASSPTISMETSSTMPSITLSPLAIPATPAGQVASLLASCSSFVLMAPKDERGNLIARCVGSSSSSDSTRNRPRASIAPVPAPAGRRDSSDLIAAIS
jgi:hypothetical protein